MTTTDDPRQLIAYGGPSLALGAPPEPAIKLLGYLDSDTAAHAIDRLLSASGVPFYLERPTGHWAGERVQIAATVSPERQGEASALLAAAAAAGLIERASGADGLVHY